jgi:AcrR family transcriptional regulator
MGIKRRLLQKIRRRLSPDSRKAELIAAAIRLMRETGDASPRIADVAHAAKAAKGTFYLYFQNWEQLLLSVRHQVADSLRAEVFEPPPETKKQNSAALLLSAGARFIDAVEELGPLHAALFHGPWSQTESADPPLPPLPMMRELLAKGLAQGELAVTDVDVAADLLFGAWHAAADAVARGADRRPYLAELNRLTQRWLLQPENSHGKR